MLNHYPVGPLEDRTYLVAYLTPGCKVATVVMEHLNEQDAISEARRLNASQAAKEKALHDQQALLSRRRVSTDLGGVA